MAKKKMTLRYWSELSRGSKERALTHIFPMDAMLVRILAAEEHPDRNNPIWQAVFRDVRIPEDTSHYKTIVFNTYIP